MREKKKILDEYCRIKINIECVFLFLLNSKTKYILQTPIVNHIIYETHKSITFDLNIKIIITVIIQYKTQAPLPWL